MAAPHWYRRGRKWGGCYWNWRGREEFGRQSGEGGLLPLIGIGVGGNGEAVIGTGEVEYPIIGT